MNIARSRKPIGEWSDSWLLARASATSRNMAATNIAIERAHEGRPGYVSQLPTFLADRAELEADYAAISAEIGRRQLRRRVHRSEGR